MLSCLYTSRLGLHASFTVELFSDDTIGYDLAAYFNLWYRRMFRFGCQQYMFTLCCMLSIILLLCVSNLRRVFSKCSFRWHSTYFRSALYPSFRRKNPHQIFHKLPPSDNFPHSAKYPFPYFARLLCVRKVDDAGNHEMSHRCLSRRFAMGHINNGLHHVHWRLSAPSLFRPTCPYSKYASWHQEGIRAVSVFQ